MHDESTIFTPQIRQKIKQCRQTAKEAGMSDTHTHSFYFLFWVDKNAVVIVGLGEEVKLARSWTPVHETLTAGDSQKVWLVVQDETLSQTNRNLNSLIITA